MAGHGHAHERPAPGHLRGAQRRALWIALGLNAAFLVVQIVGGVAFGSLALLADAAHMASDVSGLLIALGAAALATRPATTRLSYGLQRAEVLGAQANAMLLLLATAWISVEAIDRLGEDVEIDAWPVLVVGVLGLAANVVSAVLLAQVAGHSLNMRGAVLHMAADAAGSVIVVLTAIVVLLGGPTWVDPVASLLLGALVLWSALGLLRSTTTVLLEGVPAGIDPEDLEQALLADDDVAGVHHLHVWNLASDTRAVSVHLVVSEGVDLHEAQSVTARVRDMLDHDFDVGHTTIEVECHPCAEVATDQPVDRRRC